MKSARASKIATLMVHSSPLDQAGFAVNVFTRANKPNLLESVEVADCATVKDL
jgi:D-inositol-3-phosphate glycosyltransferase